MGLMNQKKSWGDSLCSSMIAHSSSFWSIFDTHFWFFVSFLDDESGIQINWAIAMALRQISCLNRLGLGSNPIPRYSLQCFFFFFTMTWLGGVENIGEGIIFILNPKISKDVKICQIFFLMLVKMENLLNINEIWVHTHMCIYIYMYIYIHIHVFLCWNPWLRKHDVWVPSHACFSPPVN